MTNRRLSVGDTVFIADRELDRCREGLITSIDNDVAKIDIGSRFEYVSLTSVWDMEKGASKILTLTRRGANAWLSVARKGRL